MLLWLMEYERIEIKEKKGIWCIWDISMRKVKNQIVHLIQNSAFNIFKENYCSMSGKEDRVT